MRVNIFFFLFFNLSLGKGRGAELGGQESRKGGEKGRRWVAPGGGRSSRGVGVGGV